MTRPIQIDTRVPADGVLTVRVPLGEAEANTDVRVTIEPLARGSGSDVESTEWGAFVRQTYGSCAGLGLEEPPDLPLQDRDGPR